MDTMIVAAFIGGGATIIAAIIALRKKEEKTNQPTQSAHSGGHSIQASGNASQTISISTSTGSDDQKKTLLVNTLDEISKELNTVFRKNQIVLAPLFEDSPDVDKVRNDIIRLYNVQTQRANFAKWQAIIIEYAKVNEKNSELYVLLHLLDELKWKFYEADDSRLRGRWRDGPVSWEETLDLYEANKIGFITILKKYPILTVNKIQDIASLYLQDLQEKSELIGNQIGKIKIKI